MNTENSFDMLILGGGPAGAKAAFRAADAGMKTALVESGFLGGACLNVGCIPTKYLLGGTAALPLLSMQKKYNVAQGEVRISLEALQTRKDRYIKGTRQALEKQLREAGVTLFPGRGLFDGRQRLIIKTREGDQRLFFNKCIVATGSVPAFFPGLKPDGATVCGSASLLSLTQIPESLIIVGAGAIGLELGEIFHRFGTKITLADLAPRILPGEEPEVSEAVHAYHSRAGWIIHTGRRIESLRTVDGQSELHFADGEKMRAAMSLVAVGRRSAASMLAPEKADLDMDARGWLAVGADLRCGEHVYAVGDVNGRVLLAHAADHQARYAVDHAAGNAAAGYAAPPMPSCVYGSMEVMRVGPTLKELQAGNLAGLCPARTGGSGEEYPLSGTGKNAEAIFQSRAPLAGNSIAQSYGYPQGFVRMLWRNETLVSVSAVGHGVSHLVSAAALLVGKKIQKNIPLPLIFAHPTLDEALESAIVASRENIG